jgi:diguanylate cyclase (GGDEF)-like protein/PAS domain S-box-containing protein
MRRIIGSPAARITASLVGITIALVLCAHALRILPDAQHEALDHRKRTVEALAVQLSSPAMLEDGDATAEVLTTVVERNTEVLSIALRDAAKQVLIEAGDHARQWREIPGGRSTAEYVRAPIFTDSEELGALEVRFKPLASPWTLSFRHGGMTALLLFITVGTAAGFFVVLRRSLKALDPSAVIPERVRLAMDNLVEGVLIMDEAQNIVLANRAFGVIAGVPEDRLLGKRADAINWRCAETGGVPAELPWVRAIRLRTPSVDMVLELRVADDSVRTFSVNATPITHSSGRVQGVLASFADKTELQIRNNELQRALTELEASREAVQQHNAELQYLATRDPLTGCLNRRAFFDSLDAMFKQRRARENTLHCAMLDIDHFKQINDKFGHGTGDRVIAFVAETIRLSVRSSDLVCRYGGEEYCIVFSEASPKDVRDIIERIRRAVVSGSAARFTRELKLTISAGIATKGPQDDRSSSMIDRADAALYAAKNNGRNRIENWREELNRDGSATLTRQRRSANDITGTWRGLTPHVDRATLTQKVSGAPPSAQEGFRERITQALALAARHSWTAALLRIKLETAGPVTHATMLEVEARVSGLLRRSDVLALIIGERVVGGDHQSLPTVGLVGQAEIAVLLPDVESIRAIGRVVQRIIKILADPIDAGAAETFLTCSVGISVAPVDGEDFDMLMHCAEQAQRVTRSTKLCERYAFYQSSMTENLNRLMRIESGLRRALERNEFKLVYQPLISLTSGKTVGLEALLRWSDADGNSVPPSEFIPVAETTGLIGAIGDWVLHMACVHARNWQRVSGESRRVAVNVSAVQIMSPGYADRVAAILNATGVDSRLVELEITESAFISNLAAAAETLHALRRIGVHISLDDFGTGYSSLAYLTQLPIDSIKIDARFVRALSDTPNGTALVTAIVRMAHDLGIRVIAEGVESAEKLALLRRIGCDQAQGYVISKPVPFQEIVAMGDAEYAIEANVAWRTSTQTVPRASVRHGS